MALRGSKLPAGFFTAVAGICAVFAMLVVVLGAFIPACFARLCTQLSGLLHQWTAGLDGFSRQGANICTFAVETYAFGHHFHVVLLQAVVKALITLLHTFDAGFEAFLLGSVHLYHPF